MTQGQIAAAVMRVEAQLLLVRAACVDGSAVEPALLQAREMLGGLVRDVFGGDPPTSDVWLAADPSPVVVSPLSVNAGVAPLTMGPQPDATGQP